MPPDRRPFFSVVIPVYNGVPYLAEAMESVAAQTFADWELIVVDDQSTDGTRALVEEFRAARPGLAIAYHYMPEKRGVCPGRVRNYGVARSRGEWVTFIDHDDKWLPAKLERHHEAALAHPEAGAIHNDEIFFDAGGPLNGGKPRLASQAGYDPAALRGDCFARQFQGNLFGLSCTSVRRTVFDAVGGFDEGIEGTDDYDLFLRIAAEYPAYFVDEALTLYRIHPTNMSKNEVFMTENLLKTVRKICAAHPERVARLPRNSGRDRLYFLYNVLGTQYAKRRETWKARRYFAGAARQIPTSVGAWARLIYPSL